MATLIQLFFRFLQIGSFSMGGGYAAIPLIQEYVVQRQAWLTGPELTDIVTISQMTPGPLAVNASTFVGMRIAGLPGAVTATAGCVLSGCVLSILVYHLCSRYRTSPCVHDTMTALKAASTGLIAAAAATILLLLFPAGENFSLSALLLLLSSLLLLRRFSIHPVLLLLLTGAAGCFLYW